jgi:1,2-phenylacetyl-CoA epoxidase PaaB subunit
MRSRATQAQFNVKKASAEDIAKLYDHYANVFLKRLEEAYGRKVLGEGLGGLTMEAARKASPTRAQAAIKLQEKIEERIYDSSVNLIKDPKYWELFKKTHKELEAHLRKVDERAFAAGAKEKALQDSLSELLVRSERIRMWKTLEQNGLKQAWGRFLQIAIRVGENYALPGFPKSKEAFNSVVRKALLESEDHTQFYLKLLGAKEPEMAKKLLTDLNLSDLRYAKAVPAAEGSATKLLTPKERALLDISLKTGLIPPEVGFSTGETSVFSLSTYKAFVKDIQKRSMKGVGEMLVANKTIADAMRRPAVRRAARAAVGMVPEAATAAEARVGRGARFKGAGKTAAALALGMLAYHILFEVGPEEFWKNASEKAGRAKDKVSAALGELSDGTSHGLSSTPKKKDYSAELDAALRKAAPLPAHSKAIAKALNSIKVNGRKLTPGEKLRALKIAALRKDNYKGKEMEKYVKIAAVMQFAPKQSEARVAMLSEEIKELVPPGEQGEVAREALKEYLGKAKEEQKAAPNPLESTQRKEMVRAFREQIERLRKKMQ